MPLTSPPAAAPRATTSPSGRLLAGRYRVGKVIGRGGMSTVYQAFDSVLDRTVAIKVLLPVLAESDPSHIARFQREARAAGSLRHRAVVKIYDTGSDGGKHYIVMEYVAGRGLDQAIRDKRFETREATRVAAQVAEAVAAAHAARVLHRDIKPANVMIDLAGNVKVLDFGIARHVQETAITQTSFAIGTASYMPPERVLGGAGDERSDIYAIGCLLYALLTGRAPFAGESAVAVMHQQVHAEPIALAKAGARVSPGLNRLVMKMLAKDPADRPGSAAEVARLLSLAAGRASEPVAPRPRSRGRRALSVAALVLVAAIVAAVALASVGGRASTPAGRNLGMTVARVGSRIARTRSQRKPSQAVIQHASATPNVSGPAGAGASGPTPSGHVAAPSPPQPPKPGGAGPGQRPGWAGPGQGRHLGWQNHGGGWGQQGPGEDGGGD